MIISKKNRIFASDLKLKTMVRIYDTEGDVLFEDKNSEKLAGMDLSGLDLSHGDFSEKDLSGADFTGSDLSNADFSNAIVEDTNFEDADLTGACFYGVLISEALSFDGAILDVYKMHDNWD